MKLVRHIAVYDLPSYCNWFQRAFLGNFAGSLESFSLLDFRGCEDAIRHSKAEQNQRGIIDYPAMREPGGLDRKTW